MRRPIAWINTALLAALAFTPVSDAGITATLDVPDVGAVINDPEFFWTFDDLNGQAFDGSVVTVDFVFSEGRSLFFEFDDPPSLAQLEWEVLLFHEGGQQSKSVYPTDELKVNGASGFMDYSAVGFEVGGSTGIGFHAWDFLLDDPFVGTAYEMTGLTFNVQLENFVGSVTGGQLDLLFIDGDGDIAPAIRVVPEPTPLAMLGLGGLTLFGRRPKSRGAE